MGSPDQPMVEVTWKNRQKMSIQLLNKRQGKVVVRAFAGVFDSHIGRLLTFVGQCTDLASNTPAATTEPVPTARALCKPRELLRSGT